MLSVTVFSHLPHDVIDIILSMTDPKNISKLYLVNVYFSLKVIPICVRSLSLRQISRIGDKDMNRMTFITSLNLMNHNLKNDTLRNLTNLTHLDLRGNNTVTNQELICLPKLTSLRIFFSPYINDEGLSLLTNLEYLNVRGSFTNDSLSRLVKLVSLDLSYGNINYDESIKNLKNLTHLGLCENVSKLSGETLKALTHLVSLNLHASRSLTSFSMGHHLTNLTALDLRENRTIGTDTLKLLTNLTSLKIKGSLIEEPAIRSLPNLIYLDDNFVKLPNIS